MSVATWQEPVRVKAIGDRTANQAFKLLRLEEWSKTLYVQAVEDLLAYLDEEKRKLIELHYFDGYPIWKVALKMGIDNQRSIDTRQLSLSCWLTGDTFRKVLKVYQYPARQRGGYKVAKIKIDQLASETWAKIRVLNPRNGGL